MAEPPFVADNPALLATQSTIWEVWEHGSAFTNTIWDRIPRKFRVERRPKHYSVLIRWQKPPEIRDGKRFYPRGSVYVPVAQRAALEGI